MFKKLFLICTVASSVVAATSIPHDYSPIFLRPFKHHRAAEARSAAARPAIALSKSAARDWKKIASIEYDNTDYSGGVAWGFSWRDTVEYSPQGYMVVTKASSAVGAGWLQGSLQSLDSCVYVNGNMAEEIQENLSQGSIYWGNRSIYIRAADGKFVVIIQYNWDAVKNTWEPSYKDSLILSGPFTDLITWDYSSLAGEFVWNFDTTMADWKISVDMARVESECTPTKVVLAGTWAMLAADSLSKCKMILSFLSPVKTINTMTGDTIQVADSVAGVYKDYWGLLYTYNQNGFQTSQRYAFYDTVTKAMQDSYKVSMFPDAYGNDTLEVDCDYTPVTASTGIWDTTIEDRFARLYDANGNTVSIITSFFDSFDSAWYVQTKDTVFFAQVNSKVLHGPTQGISSDVVIKKTLASIRFSASGISGLKLYDLSGRLVASMSQKPGPSLELVFASHNAKITTGTYVARLAIGDKEMSFKVPVLR